MKSRLFCSLAGGALVSLTLLSTPVMANFNVDDRVECRWKNGSTWYPGVIAEKTGNQVFIHYNDGGKEHTTIGKCRKIGGHAPTGSLVKGSSVSCYWKGGKTLFPGVIKEKTGNQVFIHYNDGDKEHTTLDMCVPR
jgi:hypothetical protein